MAQVSRLVNLTHEQNGTWGAEMDNSVSEGAVWLLCSLSLCFTCWVVSDEEEERSVHGHPGGRRSSHQNGS